MDILEHAPGFDMVIGEMAMVQIPHYRNWREYDAPVLAAHNVIIELGHLFTHGGEICSLVPQIHNQRILAVNGPVVVEGVHQVMPALVEVCIDAAHVGIHEAAIPVQLLDSIHWAVHAIYVIKSSMMSGLRILKRS